MTRSHSPSAGTCSTNMLWLASCFFFIRLVGAHAQQSSSLLAPLQLRERLIEVLPQSDTEQTLELFTEDALWSDATGHQAHGRSELRDMFTQLFAQESLSLNLTMTAHSAEGEPHHPSALHELGTYDETLRRKDGTLRARECGRYALVYQKNPAGGWLIAQAQWSATPCPATPVSTSR